MHTRTRRGNRLGLTLVGLLLLVAAAALALAHLGRWGVPSSQDLLVPATTEFIAANRGWLWWTLGGVAAVAGLVVLRWLLVQGRVDRLGRLAVPSYDVGVAGRTVLPARALTDAVRAMAVEIPGVQRFGADVSGSPDHPQLWLTVTASADVDLDVVRRRLVEEVVPAARTSLELPELPTYVDLRISGRASARTVV